MRKFCAWAPKVPDFVNLVTRYCRRLHPGDEREREAESMALRITVGKLPGPGFRRPQWGVRGSLFAAFAVIAAMAIVISAGAGLVLGHLGTAMVDLSGRDIPRLAASLQLSAQSASLASQGRRCWPRAAKRR